jgi:hypothetical protein
MSKLCEQGMPTEHLSDLGPPTTPRGDSPLPPARTAPEEVDPPEEQGAVRTPIRPVQSAPDVEIPAAKPGRRRLGRPRTRTKPVTVVYVSASVKARFEAYRHKQKATNLQVVLDAISTKHGELPEIIKESTFSAAPVNPLFPADPSAVRYLGGGSVQIGFSPTPAQEEVIDRIGDELGFETRSTWIAPVLNAFLPGRKDAQPSRS